MRLQRRRAAYNIDYAALNEGGGDGSDYDDAGDVDAGGDISAGEESLFKKQDPVLLRNATLETDCASAKVKRGKEWIGERAAERERRPMARAGLLLLTSSFFFLPLLLFFFVCPLSQNLLSRFLSPSLSQTNEQNRRKCPRPQSPGTGSRDSTTPRSCDGSEEKASRPPPRR